MQINWNERLSLFIIRKHKTLKSFFSIFYDFKRITLFFSLSSDLVEFFQSAGQRGWLWKSENFENFTDRRKSQKVRKYFHVCVSVTIETACVENWEVMKIDHIVGNNWRADSNSL